MKVIRAIKELHEKGLAYGRISPRNIMFKEIDELDIRIGLLKDKNMRKSRACLLALMKYSNILKDILHWVNSI